MKKILCVAAVFAALFAMAQQRQNVPVLKGKYVSDYATYYEFLNADTLIIGDTIEGELFHYRIKNNILYLRDEVDESTDSLNIFFSGIADAFTIVDFFGEEEVTFYKYQK